MKKIIIANMKMNHTASSIKPYLIDIIAKSKDSKYEIIICPPFIAIPKTSELIQDTHIKLGAQNFYFEQKGAYTGEISAEMLKDLNVDTVIIGHSERRKNFSENNKLINKKIKSALLEKLRIVFCIGETEFQRNSGQTGKVLKEQIEQGFLGLYENELNSILIAYEPVWAIGTGAQVSDKHIDDSILIIRKTISEVFSDKAGMEASILYGGSVNKSNIKRILSHKNLNGVLVGSASINSEEFLAIVNS